MAHTFTDLPQDILLLICIKLYPPDLLSLVQTCRVLHALGSSDYVWHYINQDLPLDISDGTLMGHGGPEIRRSVIRALRLDRNWRERVSKITRINAHMVVDMQYLGPNWLVTSSRMGRFISNLSIWRIGLSGDGFTTSPSCVASLEPSRAFNFVASLKRGKGDVIVISVLGAAEARSAHTIGSQLTVYQLDLRERRSNENLAAEKPDLEEEWKIEHKGVFYYTQISGSIVAAAIVDFPVANTSSRHQILLFNIDTNISLLVDSPILSEFDSGRLQFKIYSRYIILAGIYRDRIKVHVRELPRGISSTTPIPHAPQHDELSSVDWTSSIVDYETPTTQNLEMYLSPEPSSPSLLETFTLLVAHSPFSTMENGTVSVYHFPIDLSKRDLQFTNWKPTHTFGTPPNVTLESMCLGKTGYRAVWLSHQWNLDDYTLMKGSFPKVGRMAPVVVPLQPPDQALPFEPHACRSLYFEEASGRLFVAIHTGEMYILEF